MKTTQYLSIERRITAAEAGSIRERWLYGLRLLRDPEAIAKGGGLRHGVADTLIAAAAKRGVNLSAREIQWRLQCARTYPTEGQIRNAVTDFGAWRDLISANFPAYPADFDEPPADHRTPDEKSHDAATALLDLVGDQGALFPISQLEPTEATLKDLVAYIDQQDEITQRFLAKNERRREYVAVLSEAVGNDLSRSWRDAHLAAFGTEDVEAEQPADQ
jgi:hypothetical protein